MGEGRARESVGARRMRAGQLVVAGVVAGSALSGCQSSTGGASASGDGTSPGAPASPARLSVSVADRAKDVRPDASVDVRVADGQMRAVSLKDSTGRTLRGEMRDGSWHLLDMMSPGTSYTLTAAAASASGARVETRRSFTTIRPQVQATYQVAPAGETVGVGMPASVTFDSAVATPAMRAAVERRLKVTTSPSTAGSWGWTAPNQVMWRPKAYWKPGTKVSVSAALRGVQTGPRKWATEDKGASFTIAKRARIATVDLASHVMTVRDNGKVVERYPISGGRPYGKYETRSGTKIITEKNAFMVMDAASLGVAKDDPNYYRQEVRYAMRVTNTGEFLHSAPWSVWAQGRRNVSHGCVNLGPRNAKQMFSQSIVGDVVDFTGSHRAMKPGDGVSVWLHTWDEWKALSALAPQKAKKGKASAAAGRTARAGA